MINTRKLKTIGSTVNMSRNAKMRLPAHPNMHLVNIIAIHLNDYRFLISIILTY